MKNRASSGRVICTFLVFSVLVGVCLMAFFMLISVPAASASQSSHAPIFINGNGDFTSANGVNGGGSGTVGNPYIIENYVISASGANGITIQNTTAYFIVRNCLVENGGSTYNGIYLENVANGRIENNICSNNIYGIYLESSSYDNLTSNTCKNNGCGIYLRSSSYDNLTSNICSNNIYGIYLESSSHDNLTANTCENNADTGIDWITSTDGNLTSNICENNIYGIYLYYSDNNILDNNTCSNNSQYGIRLNSSSYNNLTANTCENNRYNFSVSGTSVSHFDHNIDNSNLVDGRSIYYLKDSSDLVIGSSLNIGYVGLVRCDNIRVENLVLENNEQGILLVSTENSRIENCVSSNNSSYGIYLYSSSYDNLTSNTCENNIGGGIFLESSSYDNLTSNSSNCGIRLNSSSYNNLTANTCSNSGDGIYMWSSSNNTLTNNTCENNSGDGIYLESSPYNNLTGNTSSNNSWDGIFLQYSPYCNLTANTCENNEDTGIDWITSTDGNLTGNICERNDFGIEIFDLTYSNIVGNTCSNNNWDGIWLIDIFYNNLTGNTCENNSLYGIFIESSSDCTIFCNHLLNNTENNAYDGGTNSWDNNGKGNYWSDWQPPTHPDANYNGIVDTSRPITGGSNQDYYPFVILAAPNKPTNLLPSIRQTTTNVSISCVVTDNNDNYRINVFFYDNATKNLIDNIWTDNNTTATVTWTGLARGQTCTFFARAQVGNENWSENSDTQSFKVNSLPVTENHKTEGQANPTGLTTFSPTLSWSYADNDNDNQVQRQIQVGTAENDNSMWDSTVSTSSTSATCAGSALSRGVTYRWRVRVYDNYEWSPWVSGTFMLSQSPTVTVGSSTIELTLLEAGDAPVISTSIFTMSLTIGTSLDTLLVYYARIEGTPQISADSVAPFYFDISTTNPDAISSATITFNIPKSWVAANDIIPSTLVAWRNSDGVWQTLPSRLVGEDALYYYLEATTSGFSLFGVSGQRRVVTTTENQQSSPQTPLGDQRMQQLIFIVALGIFVFSVMILVSSFKRHK